MTENEKTKATRNRRTRAQIIADLEAKLAKAKAKAEGTYDASADDTFGVKRLRTAIRTRETAMTAASNLLNGKAATEKSPALSDIDTKIANAMARIANMQAAKARAIEQIGALPADIDRLRALLAKAETGETVEFPNDLYRLPTEKSAEETEAASVLHQD